jgi:hypothetical protein
MSKTEYKISIPELLKMSDIEIDNKLKPIKVLISKMDQDEKNEMLFKMIVHHYSFIIPELLKLIHKKQ